MIHSQSGHIQIARAGYFEYGSRFPAKYLISSEEIQQTQIRHVGHVQELMRRVSFSGLASNGISSYPIIGEGIEPDQETKLGTYMVLVEGRNLSPNDQNGALIGAGVARAMDLKPGNLISLVTPTVDGAMNTIDVEVVGTFQSFSKDYDDRMIKISLSTAQQLLDTQGVNVLVLLVDETRNTEEVASLIVEKINGAGLELKTWDQLNDFYWKTVALYDRQFGVLRLIVLIMVMLAVIGAINVGVLERAGEFGTMRAIGNSGRDIVRLIVMEGAMMGTVGALIGVALGIGSAWAISRIGIPMPPPPSSNLEYTAQIRIVAPVVGGAFLIGVVATVFASVTPALRVSRIPIVDALRRLV